MDKNARFWDRIANFYARSAIPDPESYQRKLSLTQALFQGDDEVVEIGCGTGSTALIHAPHVARIQAFDFSERMLAIARAKATDQNITNIAFERRAISDIALAPNSVDVTLALSILHLLDNPRAVLAATHAWLKAGGHLVTNTAVLADSKPWLRWVAPIGKAVGLFPDFKFLSHAALLDELRSVGFEIVHDWRPRGKDFVFIIARKPGAPA